MFLHFANGTRQRVNSATYAYKNGSVAAIGPDQRPTGPTWAVNPLPDGCQAGSQPCTKDKSTTEFPPPCVDHSDPLTNGFCSGERPFQLSVIDKLQVSTHAVLVLNAVRSSPCGLFSSRIWYVSADSIGFGTWRLRPWMVPTLCSVF